MPNDASIKSKTIEVNVNNKITFIDFGIPVAIIPYNNDDTGIYQMYELYRSSSTSFGIRAFNINAKSNVTIPTNQQFLIYYIPF